MKIYTHELADEIFENFSVSQRAAGLMVKRIFEKIKREVAAGNVVEVYQFGVFGKKKVGEKKNAFAKGIYVPEHDCPRFSPADDFRKRVRGND